MLDLFLRILGGAKKGDKRQHTVVLLMQFLAIECLAESPSCVAAAKGFESDRLFLVGPAPVLLGGVLSFDAAERASTGRGAVGGQERGFHALEKDLIVNGSLGAAAEGDRDVDEVRELRGPLEALTRPHGPAQHCTQMFDAQFLGQQAVLRFHVIVEGHVRERDQVGRVGRAAGLAVAEEGGDDDEVIVWVQRQL